MAKKKTSKKKPAPTKSKTAPKKKAKATAKKKATGTKKKKKSTAKKPKPSPKSTSAQESSEDDAGGTLLEQFSEALLSAGAKAESISRWGVTKIEKLGRLGLAKAELERERFGLAKAYESVGMDVVAAFQKKPGGSLKAGDKRIAESLKAAKELLKLIDGLEKKVKKYSADDDS